MRILQRELGRFLTPRPKPQDYERNERAAFKRLAAKHGFTYAKARDGYLEIPKCPTFPDGLTTAFHGWPDALERVRHCIENPSAIDRGYYSE